ncbi:envelope stress response membrane protein PspC [Rouxiella badensis]|jgi:phage shock protein C|uniref:DNA-binding transcriptional activator PspC n=1 Tax=Rouxiella badensis TaxID=1646377 RepID=A0A1X0WEI6_9GAMM|nr:envelope stress response membrane protein PspC [Rouxiella badensis]MCC3701448.1 envelope stress response membrane protein PspC [Rouxiella badensis]MCC3717875.1 envelope stress response membrane protein PspC [Rouxiella badensis]MCC3730110.1 envelope stress response membrane protein PspC [Rouxiella badensis]MCC3734181.1 envelope stress response membrane protein PspC [Rouxiella badensis]MCC3739218.1 envelope stress response membrane protein PspC [Rouxiella badensis]
MSTTLSQRKLYRVPEEGVFKGVCAGLSHYLGVPVKLLRLIVVLSLFLGLFMFTVVAYFLLAWLLEPVPSEIFGDEQPVTAHDLLVEADRELNASEQRLRQVERYVTSETFGVRSRFKDL